MIVIDKDSESKAVLDPQLVQLLRFLFDISSATSNMAGAESSLLQQCDLASSLSVAVIATIYSNISYPFDVNYYSTALNHELFVPLLGKSFLINLSRSRKCTIDYICFIYLFFLLMLLVRHFVIDFLYAVLHHILRLIANVETAGLQSPQQKNLYIEQQKKTVSALKSVSPALLIMMACMDSMLSASRGTHNAYIYSWSNPLLIADVFLFSNFCLVPEDARSIHAYLLDISSRCLGILFDLFPDTVTSQLLAKQSVVLSESNANVTSGEKSSYLMPRNIFANVISNSRVELKVVLKLLKILYSAYKVRHTFKRMTRFTACHDNVWFIANNRWR